MKLLKSLLFCAPAFCMLNACSTLAKSADANTTKDVNNSTAAAQHEIRNTSSKQSHTKYIVADKINSEAILSEQKGKMMNKYWKLTEMMGKPVAIKDEKEAHIRLSSAQNRLTGNSGCHNFGGTYEMNANNQISFSQMYITNISCADHKETEKRFVELLSQAKTFDLNGNSLEIKGSNEQTLAKFEAQYIGQ